MKTETERLRESAENQYRKERFEELQAYIDRLMAEAETAFQAHTRYFKLELIALLTWIVTLFTVNGSIIESLAWVLWFALMFTNWVVFQPKITRSVAKLQSCFETLRILGLLDKDDDSGKRKLRRFRDNPIERLWAQIKSKMQQKVYGTT